MRKLILIWDASNTVVTDQYNNSASVAWYESKERAKKALESLVNCHGCSNCTDCHGCVKTNRKQKINTENHTNAESMHKIKNIHYALLLNAQRIKNNYDMWTEIVRIANAQHLINNKSSNTCHLAWR